MLGAPWKGYYLTAYGIAVKHGFKGTEEEWLASLKGEPGAKAQVRFNSEANALEWKTEEDEAWAQLMSLSELQTELEAATIAEAKAAAESAETAMETAEDAAKAAAADAKKAEAAEKKILQNILEYGSVVSGAYVLDGKLYIATSDGKVLTAGKVVPEKGVDYWTEEDAAGIAEAVGKAEAAQRAAEEAAAKAAEDAAEEIFEKIQFTDGGAVELGDYAKKEYVDAGDTSLKEYLDEPVNIAILRGEESDYFTNIADQWHCNDDSYLADDAYAYYEYPDSLNVNFSFTAAQDFTLAPTIDLGSSSWSMSESSFYAKATITANGAEVFSQDYNETLEREGCTNATFSPSINVKKGDEVSVSAYAEMGDEGLNTATLYLKAVIDKTEYFPGDFAKADAVNALKEYVDAGDTSLKEYYDEPKKTNIGYYNREEYFTINADTWDNTQFEDYFAYRDLEEGTGTVSVTACRELSLSGNMTVDYMGAGESVIFSMAVNGETVKEGEVTTGGKAEFALEVKKGDVIVFEVTGCTWNTMAMLTIEATEIYKLQTARDIIAEGIRNKIFTLTGDGYTNTLNPPEGYEDFFQSHEVYEGLILPTMITSLSYIYNAEFRITDGKECNSIRNAPGEDTALANKTFGLLVCTSHTSNEMDYDVWQFVELYPNLLRFIDGESFKSKAESAISTLLRYAENSDLGLDLAESSFEVTYGWEYAEKGKSFIFTPTSVEHAGATAAGITLYYSELGSDTKRYYIKEYDSDGNLVDPTLVAGKPVLLVNNGTYLIAVR